MLNLDLEHFFPSINFGRVFGLFKALGVEPKAAAIWAHLVTCDGVLPQGASTSPVVSNMIARGFDRKMMGLARRFHFRYSRYADDITLSTTKSRLPSEIVEVTGTGLDVDNIELQPKLVDIIHNAGFRINERKTRVYGRGVRQEVTGLIVNDMVNVQRQFVRQIRAMVHAAHKFGLNEAGNEYIRRYLPPGKLTLRTIEADAFDPGEYFRSVVYGKLAYLRMVRGATYPPYVKLCLKMAEVDPSPPTQVREIMQMHERFEVFICHASEDKEAIARPVYKALEAEGVVTFLDEEYIAWGDSFIEKINNALSQAKYVLVILSHNSVEKTWPRKEIRTALAREIDGHTKILPLMVGSPSEITAFRKSLPLLHETLYKEWDGDPERIAAEISAML